MVQTRSSSVSLSTSSYLAYERFEFGVDWAMALQLFYGVKPLSTLLADILPLPIISHPDHLCSLSCSTPLSSLLGLAESHYPVQRRDCNNWVFVEPWLGLVTPGGPCGDIETSPPLIFVLKLPLLGNDHLVPCQLLGIFTLC